MVAVGEPLVKECVR